MSWDVSVVMEFPDRQDFGLGSRIEAMHTVGHWRLRMHIRCFL